jgi:hypothetical protein
MANMPHKFLDRDIRRVIKVVQSVGLVVEQVSVNPATGFIVAGVREASAAATEGDDKAAQP